MKCLNALSTVIEVFVVFVVGRLFSRFFFVSVVLSRIAFDFPFFDFSFLEIFYLSNDINLVIASSTLVDRCRGSLIRSYLSVVID
jgi:hypothetical protein